MNTLASVNHDPKNVSSEEPIRYETPKTDKDHHEEIRNLSRQEATYKELTDYSFDPDEDWVELRPGRKMEENY